ncbi:MAG: hypothetical protein L0Y58_04435 [Verrucomicrobia subdivision 3 bacterium]|nr:hypothetical protein [Limisphaerales bacterium]
MNRFSQAARAACIAIALCWGASNVGAQEEQPRRERGDRPERGNFDPEQFRARMNERIREQLEIKSDEEWKVIEPRIAKVNEARRAVGPMGFGRGGFGGPPRGDRDGGGGDGGRRRGGFGPEPSPEAEALQKAIESKASNEEIKAKLAKFRESRKAKEAELAKAQDELRKVLSVRQEASAVMMGLLQ